MVTGLSLPWQTHIRHVQRGGRTQTKMGPDLRCYRAMSIKKNTRYMTMLNNFVSSQAVLRDWSLITRRAGGYKIRKSRVRNCLHPLPPSRQGKTFWPPLLIRMETFCAPPPFNMAKTPSYCVKTTPKLGVLLPPFSMAETFSTAFLRGKTSHASPRSRFVAPPLPPVISDQSLTMCEIDQIY